MANPFPGMDPYLEGDLWMSVHTDLCAEIARQLAPKLRPKYVVLSTRRVVLAPPDKTALPEPIPHVSVEIRDVAQRRLVTCIEVLSPTNKTGPGREEYAGKRYQIISGSAHLLEIDLLRAGTHFAVAAPLPPAPYYVFLSRVERRHEVEVWPIPLAETLPTVWVPLLAGDADQSLDLQQALRTVYDILGYDELIDYRQPPPGPLSAAERAWVDEHLLRTGRR